MVLFTPSTLKSSLELSISPLEFKSIAKRPSVALTQPVWVAKPLESKSKKADEPERLVVVTPSPSKSNTIGDANVFASPKPWRMDWMSLAPSRKVFVKLSKKFSILPTIAAPVFFANSFDASIWAKNPSGSFFIAS